MAVFEHPTVYFLRICSLHQSLTQCTSPLQSWKKWLAEWQCKIQGWLTFLSNGYTCRIAASFLCFFSLLGSTLLPLSGPLRDTAPFIPLLFISLVTMSRYIFPVNHYRRSEFIGAQNFPCHYVKFSKVTVRCVPRGSPAIFLRTFDHTIY